MLPAAALLLTLLFSRAHARTPESIVYIAHRIVEIVDLPPLVFEAIDELSQTLDAIDQNPGLKGDAERSAEQEVAELVQRSHLRKLGAS